jgi:DNA-binding NtrC family response regulator
MLTPARVLLVTTEEPEASVLRQLVTSAGHEGLVALSIDDAAHQLAQGQAEVVVLAECRDPRGLERLVAAPCASQAVSFVLLAQNGSTSAARDALRLGATDVVARSAGEDAIVVAVERAVRESRRLRELAMLRARVGEKAERTLIGRSGAITRVRELVGRAAASRVTVLVTGEAGTGKDAVARLVHDLSERASRPYVSVRCANADAAALELELFGRTGSATSTPRAGLLEDARGGTVVLEDASTLPSALRTQLANAIATRTTRRIGATATLPSDVRLILTSRGTETGEPYEELLHAFNAMPIVLPPLRERRSDIPQLVNLFRQRFAAEHDLELGALSPEEMLPLLGHEWSGNVRELEHWVERTALASKSEGLAANTNANVADLSGIDLGAARVTLEQLERAYILHVLAQESGHQSRASVRLGIDRRTLYRKLKQYRSESAAQQRAG